MEYLLMSPVLHPNAQKQLRYCNYKKILSVIRPGIQIWKELTDVKKYLAVLLSL